MTGRPASVPAKSGKSLVRPTIAAILFVLVPFFLFGDRIETAATQYLGADLQPYALAAFLAAMLAVDAVLPMPSSVLAAAAAAKLETGTALAVIAFGTFGSAVLCYAIGRVFRKVAPAGSDGAPAPNIALAVLVTRGVPVLAETTALLAGSVCPLRPFLVAAGLSSVLLAVTYVAVVNSGLSWFDGDVLILVCSVLVPLLAAAVALLARRRFGVSVSRDQSP